MTEEEHELGKYNHYIVYYKLEGQSIIVDHVIGLDEEPTFDDAVALTKTMMEQTGITDEEIKKLEVRIMTKDEAYALWEHLDDGLKA